MKVYTKVVIDLQSMEVIEEESFEYDGEIAEAKGGGGASGKVDYPSYMKEIHESWLNRTGTDNINTSITAHMNAAFGNSPFAGYVANNAAPIFGTLNTPIFDIYEEKAAIDIVDTFNTIVSDISNSSAVTNLIDAAIDLLDEDFTSDTLPRFQSGMRDIGAVQSSSYVIGQAIMENYRAKQVAKITADAKYKLLDIAQSLLGTFCDWNKTMVVQSAELARIYLASTFDETKLNAESAAKDRLWDLRIWEYGSHVLAGISGGVAGGQGEEHSTVQNVMGGALAGASIGAQTGGGGYGVAIGAVVGGVAGAFA